LAGGWPEVSGHGADPLRQYAVGRAGCPVVPLGDLREWSVVPAFADTR
jgi:hypothetical protein